MEPGIKNKWSLSNEREMTCDKVEKKNTAVLKKF